MDCDTKIQDLKDRIKAFCDARDWDQFHGAKELAIGISTEASEILEKFRFKSDEEIKEMFKDDKKKEEISEEIADTFYFILRMAQMYDIDLSDALKSKMDKNDKKYPVEKAKGSNKKYNEL